MVTNEVPYTTTVDGINLYTNINSCTVEKSGLYNLYANFSFGENVDLTTHGAINFRFLKNDNVILGAGNSMNSTYPRYNNFIHQYTSYLEKGDVIKISINQFFSKTSVNLVTNQLKLIPIYYTE